MSARLSLSVFGAITSVGPGGGGTFRGLVSAWHFAAGIGPHPGLEVSHVSAYSRQQPDDEQGNDAYCGAQNYESLSQGIEHAKLQGLNHTPHAQGNTHENHQRPYVSVANRELRRPESPALLFPHGSPSTARLWCRGSFLSASSFRLASPPDHREDIQFPFPWQGGSVGLSRDSKVETRKSSTFELQVAGPRSVFSLRMNFACHSHLRPCRSPWAP